MELSEKDLASLSDTIAAEIWTSGDFRGYTSDELTRSVRDGVQKGLDKLNDEPMLYYFSMHRYLSEANIPINVDTFREAEKAGGRSYIRVVAEDQASAIDEAVKISGPPLEGMRWLFRTESISVVY